MIQNYCEFDNTMTQLGMFWTREDCGHTNDSAIDKLIAGNTSLQITGSYITYT